MSVYGIEPDPVTDDQVTEQHEKAARARYARAHVRALLRKREPELSRAIEHVISTL